MRRLGGIAAVVTVLACAVATTASAESPVPVEGPWVALTSDELPVTFAVGGGQVVDAHFGFHWGFCGDYASTLSNLDPIDADGHWAFTDSRGPSIEGTFVAPDRVEGTVKAPGRSLPGCPATTASFVAVPGTKVPPALPILIPDGMGHLLPRPHRIAIAADGSFYLYGLHWDGISAEEASAHGHAYVRRGCRGCADAVVRRPRVIVDFAGPVRGAGHRSFRRAYYDLEGHLPRGVKHSGVRTFQP